MTIPPPNPLTTVSVWIAAIYMAVREGAERTPRLSNLAEAMGGVWSYLPLGVLVFAALVYLVRLFSPEQAYRPNEVPELRKGRTPDARKLDLRDLASVPEAPPIDPRSAIGQALAAPVASNADLLSHYGPRDGPDRSDGVPNISLLKAYQYISRGTFWAAEHRPSPEAVLLEMRDKLYLRELSAWGSREPGGPIERLAWKQWNGLRLHPPTGNVFAEDNQPIWYGVQFDIDQVTRVWVPSRI